MSSSINRIFGGGQDDVHSVSDDNNKMNNGQSYPRQAQQEEGALALLATMNNSTKISLPRSCLIVIYIYQQGKDFIVYGGAY